MPAPVPLSTNAELRAEISDFHEVIVSPREYDKFTFARLERACMALKNKQVIEGSLCLALLYSAICNFEQAERWFKNAELNRGEDLARIDRFAHCVNNGFATEGHSLAAKIFEIPTDQSLMHIAEGVQRLGGVEVIVKAVDAATKMGKVLKMTSTLGVAKNSATVMGELGITDADIAAVIDQASELERASGRLWSTACDIMAVDRSNGGPHISIDYRVKCDPTVAAKQTGELLDVIIQKGLDKPGLHVGFYGIALENRVAA